MFDLGIDLVQARNPHFMTDTITILLRMSICFFWSSFSEFIRRFQPSQSLDTFGYSIYLYLIYNYNTVPCPVLYSIKPYDRCYSLYHIQPWRILTIVYPIKPYIYIYIWVWVNTYRYIFSGMNIHLLAILMFTRGTGFWPIFIYIYIYIYISPFKLNQYHWNPSVQAEKPHLSSWWILRRG